MNSTLTTFQRQALAAATTGDWQAAAEHNQAIIAEDEQNVSALNRLGFAYTQLGNLTKAKKTYQRVLELEPLNTVAQKHLDRIKSQKGVGLVSSNGISASDFVEEPGKTKIIALDRLCEPQVLRQLGVAAACQLKPRGRFVTVTTMDGKYIGSLPEDISRHLAQLMKTGNRYECVIKSVGLKECSVFIRETHRSTENTHTPSFFHANQFHQFGFDDGLYTESIEDEDVVSVATDEDEETLTPEPEADSEEYREQIPPEVISDMLHK